MSIKLVAGYSATVIRVSTQRAEILSTPKRSKVATVSLRLTNSYTFRDVEQSTGGQYRRREMITITYKVTELGDGFKQYERTLTVPNYRTLRSLLSAVDAACMEIEMTEHSLYAEPRKGTEL
jgi:hypothetical protein